MTEKTVGKTIHPSARIADLIGLLYTLSNTFHGTTDLYELEDEMEVDLDDLMPIVYTAANLGFVTIGEGDIVITDKGLEFLHAGLKKRKELLRNSIKKVEPFVTALRLGTFTVDALLEELQRNSISLYTNPAGTYLLELTLIEWGIYSGLVQREGEVYRVTQGYTGRTKS